MLLIVTSAIIGLFAVATVVIAVWQSRNLPAEITTQAEEDEMWHAIR